MEVGYLKTKDCRGGNQKLQNHDKAWNNRLNKRRAKEKKAKQARKNNRRD